MNDTPIKYPKGLRLSADECKFLEGCLLGIAETARKEKDPKMFNISMGLSQRIVQAEMAGDGVPPEMQTQLQEGLNRAIQSGKPELSQRAMENFLATMIRLHPDPARAMSVFVVDYVNKTVTASIVPVQETAASEGALQILERIKIKLEGLNKGYDAEDAWPESNELIAYLAQWTNAGITALEAGKEPWAKDVHLRQAMVEQSGDDN